MKLVDEVTGQEVKVGDKRKDFRGEEVTVKGIYAPGQPGGGGGGRVLLKYPEPDGHEFPYYPGVVKTKFVD